MTNHCFVGNNNNFASLQVDNGRPALVLDTDPDAGGHRLAIYLQDGEPVMQVRRGDEVKMLNLFDLACALESLGACV